MDNEMQQIKFRQEREALKAMEGTVNNCPFRTRYHIMPPVGWLNDPNGLCQFRRIYHAYFQYSPLSVHGGGGYWGHCISTDLLHWEYKPPVLTTDIPEDAGGVYSGSALIEDDHMYLFYTGNVKMPGDYDYIDSGRISTQILTGSGDGQHMSEKVKLLGMEDYPEDITQHVRDPKVWKEDGRYYMMSDGSFRVGWLSFGDTYYYCGNDGARQFGDKMGKILLQKGAVGHNRTGKIGQIFFTKKGQMSGTRPPSVTSGKTTLINIRTRRSIQRPHRRTTSRSAIFTLDKPSKKSWKYTDANRPFRPVEMSHIAFSRSAMLPEHRQVFWLTPHLSVFPS